MAKTSGLTRFLELVRGFDTAIVVTLSKAGPPRGRPMSIVSVEPDGHLWFATAAGSGKAEELLGDPRVAVVMQGAIRFVSVTGEAEIHADRARIREVWNESFRPWFPLGPDDPSLVLVRVRPHDAELWDLSGMRGVRYLLEAFRTVARRERMTDAAVRDYHRRVDLG